MAGAAVALVLAVVVVGDLGGGDSGDEGAGRFAFDDVLQRESASEAGSGEYDAEAPAAATSGQLPAEMLDGQNSPDTRGNFESGAQPCPAESAGGTGTDAGGAGAPGTAPEPAASPSLDEAASADCAPIAANQADATAAEDLADELREGAAEGGGGAEPATPSSDDGDGISAVTVVEIVLGGALLALVFGIIAEAALRRRRAV
jgi:hypothetical protein